jgi:hypothetical protein
MAHILDNPNGRRMIRLSPEDVLAVVQHYQQQTYNSGGHQYIYVNLQNRLSQFPLYLPEDS